MCAGGGGRRHIVVSEFTIFRLGLGPRRAKAWLAISVRTVGMRFVASG